MYRKMISLIAFTIIVLFVCTDILSNFANDFLTDTLAIGAANIGIVAGLKGLISMASSTQIEGGIVVTSGSIQAGAILEGLNDMLDWAFNFFIISNFLIMFQIILLNVSKLLLVKILLAVSLIATFIKPVKKYALTVFMILLFINPGLPIFVSLTKITYDYALPDTSEIIQDKFEVIRNNFEQMLVAEGLLNKVAGSLKAMWSVVTESIAGLAELIITYFASMVLLFGIMPFLFFFLLKKIFNPLLSLLKTDTSTDTSIDHK
ncbi:hypothetical protein ACFL4Q_05095 [candidate division KSB1 bacterium]